jgi:hypothetical protein
MICAGFDLTVLNTGARTLFCLWSGTLSALDLAFCRPGLAAHLEWSVLQDLYGSDRHPVNLYMSTPSPTVSRNTKWITKRAS